LSAISIEKFRETMAGRGTTLKLAPALLVSQIALAGNQYLCIPEVDEDHASALLEHDASDGRLAASGGGDPLRREPAGSRCLTYFRSAIPDSWSTASSTATTSSAGSSAAEARSARRREGAEVGWRRRRGADWGLELEVEGRERRESVAVMESAMLARRLVRVGGALWIGKAEPRGIILQKKKV
jgi:hypothetical protein